MEPQSMDSSQAYLLLYYFLWVFRYSRLVVNILANLMLKPIPPLKDPKLTGDDVTVVIPCLEYNEKLAKAVSSVVAAGPRKIVIVIVEDGYKKHQDELEDLRKIGKNTDIQIITVQKPSKRKQLAAGIKDVTTKIAVFVDDDVDWLWPIKILFWLLAPFDKSEATGAVGTCQGIQPKNTQCLSERIWYYLGQLYVERRNFDCAATNYIDGGVPCLSGRTAAYRTRIVQDPQFLDGFCNETWAGRELGPDDDNYSTRWLIRDGWRIVFQPNPEAKVRTTLEGNPKYLLQCVRWSRSNWRSNLRSLTKSVTYRRHPYSVYAVFMTTLLPPAFIIDGLLVWLCHKGTENDRVVNRQSIILLLGWMFISKFIKFLDYYRRHPSNIILLPISVLFGYAHGFIKVYALLTLHVTVWGTRNFTDPLPRRKDHPIRRTAAQLWQHLVHRRSPRLQAAERICRVLAPLLRLTSLSQRLCLLGVVGCILMNRALNFILPFKAGEIVEIVRQCDEMQLYDVGTHAVLYLLEKVQVTNLVFQTLRATLMDHWLREIKIAAYKKVMSLSGDFHEHQRPGYLSDSISDGAKGFESLIDYAFFVFVPVLLDLVFFTCGVYYSFGSGLTLLCLTSATAYLWYYCRHLSQDEQRLRRETRDSGIQERDMLRESVSKWAKIACFNKFQQRQQYFSELVDRHLRSGTQLSLSSAVRNIKKDAFFALILVVALVARKNMPAKDVAILWARWEQLLPFLRCLSHVIDNVKNSLVNLEHVIAILEQDPSVVAPDNPTDLRVSDGDIRFKNVDFSYDGQRQLLTDVSFNVPGGQTAAVVGDSGCGKSTLLKLLSRRFNPQSGSIHVDGHDISNVNLETLRDNIAVVFQKPLLFMDSIRENVRFGKTDATEKEIHTACKKAAIHDRIIEHEDGYNRAVQQLSGGEQQRIAIACAILRGAKLLIFDEPTSNLDSETAAQIRRNLLRKTKGQTKIVITHDRDMAKEASHIIVMRNGRVVEQGTHADLLRLQGYYHKTWSHESTSGLIRQPTSEI